MSETAKEVVLYTKAMCPFCVRAKSLLEKLDISFTEHDYKQLSEDEVAALKEKTDGYRLVPQIFIGDYFVGGFDGLSELHKTGKLTDML